ncbi:Techylectin-5A, partial [Araneus ventricosus]
MEMQPISQSGNTREKQPFPNLKWRVYQWYTIPSTRRGNVFSRQISFDFYVTIRLSVIQRRGQYGNGENYFNKKWKEYKEGFGNMQREFWLGNDHIYAITNQDRYVVRFEMTNDQEKSVFTHFENFWIE